MKTEHAAPAGRAPFFVAVVGAPGTGKTRLALALADHFGALGWNVAVAAGSAPGDAPAAEARLVIADAPASLEHPGVRQATLLAGLDLPGPPERAAADAALRERLARAGLAFDVVYGRGPQRLASAVSALARRGIGQASPAPQRRAWTWSCEKCSDPECEHRLFRGLLG